MPSEVLELSVGEFVALLNQTLEYAYPTLTIVGELANFKIWRDRLVFFDLKEGDSIVNCWAYVSQLPGPLEDGMLLKVRGQPRYHPSRGFRFNTQFMQPAGEGSIRRAADLLRAKLEAEGLFDESRKRSLPFPPARIGLVTSKQSAAYADFIKILNARWHGLAIELIDVQVQGESAPAQIVAALEQFNVMAGVPNVIVLIRGGGSAEDLAAFSTESVTRAVAASRVPTLVAIGHEVDVSLAELAADRRASTPSNAAELLVPDRREALVELAAAGRNLGEATARRLQLERLNLKQHVLNFERLLEQMVKQARASLKSQAELIEALNPSAVLRRGYAVVRIQDRLVRSAGDLSSGDIVSVQLADGGFDASVSKLKKGKHV